MLDSKRENLRRITGIDFARGLAVLGMFAQHFANLNANRQEIGTLPWFAGFLGGGPTILFCLVGGISLGLMSGRRSFEEVASATQTRLRIALRGVFFLFLGAILDAISPGVGVILSVYGLCYFVAILFLGVRPFVLLATSLVMLVTFPFILLFIQSVIDWRFPGDDTHLQEFIAPQGLAVAPLLPYFLLGLSLCRLCFRYSITAVSVMTAAGAGVGLVGMVILPMLGRVFFPGQGDSAVTSSGEGPSDLTALLCAPGKTPQFWDCLDPTVPTGNFYPEWVSPNWGQLFVWATHSNSLIETVGVCGIGVMLIGFCLLLGRMRQIRFLVHPFAEVGRMAFSMYSAQFIYLWLLYILHVDRPEYEYLWVAGFALVVSTIWLHFRQQGPLEQLLARFTRRFTAGSL